MIGNLSNKYVTALPLYLFTFIPLSNFPNFDGPYVFFSKIQQAPGPNYRKVGKSLWASNKNFWLESNELHLKVTYPSRFSWCCFGPFTTLQA